MIASTAAAMRNAMVCGEPIAGAGTEAGQTVIPQSQPAGSQKQVFRLHSSEFAAGHDTEHGVVAQQASWSGALTQMLVSGDPKHTG